MSRLGLETRIILPPVEPAPPALDPAASRPPRGESFEAHLQRAGTGAGQTTSSDNRSAAAALAPRAPDTQAENDRQPADTERSSKAAADENAGGQTDLGGAPPSEQSEAAESSSDVSEETEHGETEKKDGEAHKADGDTHPNAAAVEMAEVELAAIDADGKDDADEPAPEEESVSENGKKRQGSRTGSAQVRPHEAALKEENLPRSSEAKAQLQTETATDEDAVAEAKLEADQSTSPGQMQETTGQTLAQSAKKKDTAHNAQSADGSQRSSGNASEPPSATASQGKAERVATPDPQGDKSRQKRPRTEKSQTAPDRRGDEAAPGQTGGAAQQDSEIDPEPLRIQRTASRPTDLKPSTGVATAEVVEEATQPTPSSSTAAADSDAQVRATAGPGSRSAPPVPGQPAADSDPANRMRFVQRVAQAFEAISGRGGKLRLRLHPPELGSLQLEITVKNGAMTARVEADTPAARTLLLDNLPALRERLAAQDIKVERFDVDLSDRSADGSPQFPGDHPQSEDRPDSDAPHTDDSRQAETENAGTPHAPARSGEGTQLNVVV